MRRSRRGHGPSERPTVRVKHRQRPQIAVGRRHRPMHQGTHRIHPCVAMSDHHAFGPRGRPAGVIDREQIRFDDFAGVDDLRAVFQQRLVLEPIRPAALECDEMPHSRHALAHAVDQFEIVRMGTQNLRAAMRRHVDEILGREPVIHRHDHGAQLRNRVELFEVLMGIRRDRGDPIALCDAEPRKSGRPPVTAVGKLAVGQPHDHHRSPLRVAECNLRARRAKSKGVSGVSMRELP